MLSVCSDDPHSETDHEPAKGCLRINEPHLNTAANPNPNPNYRT